MASPTAAAPAPAPAAPAERVSPVLILAALALVAVNLRPALSSVSAELNDIRAALGLSGFAAGILTTLPALCMAAFATLAAPLARRAGLERTMLAGIVLIGIATAARGFDVGAASFMALTFAIGVGIAVAQALVPPIVKAYFAHAPGSPTGFFTVCIHVGALLGGGLTVPATEALGGDWRYGLAVWALLALPAVVIWTVLARRSAISIREGEEPGERVRVDRGLALRIMLVMSGVSLTFYVPLAWLVSTFEDVGYSESTAVALYTAFLIGQIPAALIIPSLTRTPRARGLGLTAMVTLGGLGLLALGAFPDFAPLVWSLALGAAAGSAFPLGLTMPVDHTPTPAHAAALTGVVFTGSYIVAALGPAIAGILRDATGDSALPLAIFGVVVLCVVPIAWGLASRPAPSG